MSTEDAASAGVVAGDWVRLTTKRGSVESIVEVTDSMRSGHVSLPNGLGLDYPDADGTRTRRGVAPNELTSTDDRDWLAGTPWHKHVRAQIVRIEGPDADARPETATAPAAREVSER
jgi:formate dehydrogenase